MKKVISLILVAVLLLSMVACSATSEPTTTPAVEIAGQTPAATEPETTGSVATDPTAEPVDEAPELTIGDDAAIFEAILGEYQALLTAADETLDINERYVRFAMAEAALLDSAVTRPYSNCGYSEMISRIAPNTMPMVAGVEQGIYVSAVVSSDIITAEEYDEMVALWQAEAAGEGTYDAAAYLTGKGHTIQSDIVETTSYTPETLDIHGSVGSELSLFWNTEMTLVANDSHGNLIPWLAESYEISDDGLTYTFHIRKGVNWYTAEGQIYGEVTAEDFVAGMQHFLDLQIGTQSNCDPIVGATDYYANGGSWDDVAIKATDEYTVVITLNEPTPYFLSLCTYLYFRPICKSFYEAHGGAFGVQECAEAAASATYNYGLASDISTQLYCGPYRLTKLVAGSEFKIVKNESFFAADSMTVNSVTFVYDDGSVPTQTAQAFLDGTYATCYPMEGVGSKELLVEAGYEAAIHSCASAATEYLLFNVNRRAYSAGDDAVSVKNEDTAMQTSTQKAIWNNSFRKGVISALNAVVLNAAEAGESLSQSLCRNTATPADLVSLSADTTVDGYSFKAGTTYGELVQFFADERGLGVNLKDGQDGWYSVDGAKAYMEAAKAELGDSVSWPIHLDIMIPDAGWGSYYIPLVTSIKQSIEDSIGEYVVVDILIADTLDGYYLGLSSSDALNTDIFYCIAWGVMFQDPIEPLRIFQGYGAGIAGMYMGLF